jgi:hypothetical protein
MASCLTKFPQDPFASSMMVLLCAKVDNDTIWLIGCWHSLMKCCTIHIQAKPVMYAFASCMITQGTFMLHPNHEVPLY